MKARVFVLASFVFASTALIGCDETKTAQPKLKEAADTRLVPAVPGGPPGGGGAPKPAPKPD